MKNIKKGIIGIVSIGFIVLLSCAGNASSTDKSKLSNAVSDAKNIEVDTLIHLKKTPCFGRCPVYNFTIFTNGLVHYNGLRNVEIPGPHSGKLSTAQIDLIKLKIIEYQIFMMPKAFPTGNVRISDLPTTETLIKLDSSKTLIVNGNHEDSENEGSYYAYKIMLSFEKLLEDMVLNASLEPRKTSTE